MKRYRSILVLLIAVAVMLGAETAVSSAKTYKLNGTSEFDGSKITSSFKTGKVADTISGLQPGDSVTFRVRYKNKYDGPTDWYMTNDVIQTLEKANSSRKKVKGTGTPENGAYTYELIHTDKKGRDKVIFSNSKVGGEETPGDMQGLEQATNALDEWFYLQSLDKGESGKITLNIAFDGETEVNDYMDTDGSVELAFAVDKPKTVTKPSRPSGTPASPGRKAVKSGVRTGDYTRLLPYVLLMLTGIILLIAVFKYKGGESDETE